MKDSNPTSRTYSELAEAILGDGYCKVYVYFNNGHINNGHNNNSIGCLVFLGNNERDGITIRKSHEVFTFIGTWMVKENGYNNDMIYIGKIIGRDFTKVFDIAHKRIKYPDKRFDDGSYFRNWPLEVGRLLLNEEGVDSYCDAEEDYIEWLYDVDDESNKELQHENPTIEEDDSGEEENNGSDEVSEEELQHENPTIEEDDSGEEENNGSDESNKELQHENPTIEEDDSREKENNKYGNLMSTKYIDISDEEEEEEEEDSKHDNSGRGYNSDSGINTSKGNETDSSGYNSL